jgi:phosphatidate cytidylyltransferase
MVQGPKKHNLLVRITSALIMLPVAIYVILAGGMAYFVLIIILLVMILSEWNGICEKKPISILFFVQSLCSILLMIQLTTNSPYLLLSFLSSLVSIAAVSYLFKAKIKWALLGFLYALIPSGSFILIHENGGAVLVLWMMIVIWAMDIGAYFAGKNIGGPKMAPTISPNKTWAGLIGGTVVAVLFGGLYGYYLTDTNTGLFSSVTILLLLSGFLAILSQVGDLAESALKRNFSVKDSGSIIPGHGGIMDRIDGVTFVAPAVFIIHNIII